MNTKLLTALCVAGLIAGASFVLAQSKSTSDADRIDKLIQQNEQILKNQEEMMKQLKDINENVFVLKRRSS